MNETNGLREEILKKNGIEPGSLTAAQQQQIQQMMARENKKMRRKSMRAVFFWVLAVFALAFYMGMVKVVLIKPDTAKDCFGPIVFLDVLIPFLIIAAVLSTFALNLQSQTLTLLKIHDRLANIEELLKELQKKS